MASDADGRTPLSDTPRGRDALVFAPVEHQPDGLALDSELSDEVIGYRAEAIAERPEPLLEIGGRFLSSGPIPAGVELPTGQVFQPSLIVFGDLRSAVQSHDSGSDVRTEWANRLDLFANLSLSGTERVLLGLRPIDGERGQFTGYSLEPDEDSGWESGFNSRIRTLYFEGEFGELFPGLDDGDRHALDYGLTIGRVPLLVQDGFLVDDDVDLLGVTRNSLTAEGVSNLRLTGLVGWSGVDQGGGADGETGAMVGLLTAADTSLFDSSMALDLLFVDGHQRDSDACYLGGSSVQRLGVLDTTFRVATSVPLHGDTPSATAGTLLASEVAYTLEGREHVVYANGFWSIDQFSSAARGPDRGDAVARIGILFEPVGMGTFGIPLGGALSDTVGGALGYQHFLNGTRGQIVFEIGGRGSLEGEHESALALGARYQRAFGQHQVLRLDAFVATREGDDSSQGIRAEWRVKF
ncbi:hypothetical protein Pla86_43020 [Planctomycetes bacterium Pla86]|uniref:Uncharacterized protein n=2 Tax=Engelhardtia mirabilis TaxID=2528011 RepID=A0A518BQD0_9BACT|nr:hypothetical protein Pla133_43030 [Planctomycetes bacterium Pla133]QDV03513.1 hypothetical protein Pla86_43020 [Planctomycetes bacterium Pla86]